MNITARLGLILLIGLTVILPVFAQEKNDLASAVRQLLDHPAPAPPPLKEVTEALAIDQKWRDQHYDSELPEPGAGATPRMLTAYWEIQARIHPTQPVPEETRWRLLEACLTDPRFEAEALAFIPDTPKAYEMVRQYLEHPIPLHPDTGEDIRNGTQYLHDWLMRHSRYFRDELIRRAKDVRRDDQQLKGDDDLAALARLDWATARPIIEGYLNSPDVGALAIGLLYKYAEETDNGQSDSLRGRLQAIVSDNSAPVAARKSAMDALMQGEWAGRDEWFISQFVAERSPADNPAVSDVLAVPVKRDPDKWIPILTPMVGSRDRNVHDAAVHCLSQFVMPAIRRDAIKPLLPWLTDPKWAADKDEQARNDLFLVSLWEVSVPEATPYLISLLQDADEPAGWQAAHLLARHPDAEAISALRKAFEQATARQETNEALVLALTTCNGLSDAEQVAALEAIATRGSVQVSYFHGRRDLDIHMDRSAQEDIGKAVIQGTGGTESVAAGVIAQWKKWRKENPQAAERLWLLAQKWDQPALAVADAERIADGSADFETLRAALNHRKTLQTHAGNILQPLIARGGLAAGISAAILDDQPSALTILNGKDLEARMALLACSRMTRGSLPVEQVNKLLSHKNERLRLAAQRYLESVDTPEAHRLIQAYHPGELLVLGAYESFDPKPERREDWIEWEDGMRNQVKDHRADEIFGQRKYSFSDDGSHSLDRIEVRVRDDKAELCKRSDAARQQCRMLAPDELQALRGLFDEVSFDDLPPVRGASYMLGGTEQEIVRINKAGGRRVYASDLDDFARLETRPPQNQTPHERIASFFDHLAGTGQFTQSPAPAPHKQ